MSLSELIKNTLKEKECEVTKPVCGLGDLIKKTLEEKDEKNYFKVIINESEEKISKLKLLEGNFDYDQDEIEDKILAELETIEWAKSKMI